MQHRSVSVPSFLPAAAGTKKVKACLIGREAAAVWGILRAGPWGISAPDIIVAVKGHPSSGNFPYLPEHGLQE